MLTKNFATMRNVGLLLKETVNLLTQTYRTYASFILIEGFLSC